MKLKMAFLTIIVSLSTPLVVKAASPSQLAEATLSALKSINTESLNEQDRRQMEFAKSNLMQIQIESVSTLPKCSIVGGVSRRNVLVEGQGLVSNGSMECGPARKIINELIANKKCVLQPNTVCGY